MENRHELKITTAVPIEQVCYSTICSRPLGRFRGMTIRYRVPPLAQPLVRIDREVRFSSTWVYEHFAMCKQGYLCFARVRTRSIQRTSKLSSFGRDVRGLLLAQRTFGSIIM